MIIEKVIKISEVHLFDFIHYGIQYNDVGYQKPCAYKCIDIIYLNKFCIYEHKIFTRNTVIHSFLYSMV